MPPRLLTAVAAALLAVTLLGSCGSEHDPYDALSPEARQYIIPGSGGWTSGGLCSAGGDCSGPITVSVIERYDWFRITDLAVEAADVSGGSVEVQLRIAEARMSDRLPDEAPIVHAWGPDVDDVHNVLISGFEVWAGVSAESGYAVVFTAFDEDGRLAGIGYAAAEYFTVPVAQLAAEANALSGFAFLDPLMAR